MDAKISLVLACLTVLFIQGSALRCYRCQALKYKPMGGWEDWVTHSDETFRSDDRCWKKGPMFRMNSTGWMECPEPKGMKPICTITQAWWDQTSEGHELDMKYISRNCSVISEADYQNLKMSDKHNTLQCMEFDDSNPYKKPEQRNYWGNSCSCMGDNCNMGHEGPKAAGASHVTISTLLLLAAAMVATLNC